MATLASLLIALGIDAGDYEKGLNKAVGMAEKAGSDIGSKLAGIGGGLVIGAIAAVGAGLAAMGGFLVYATEEASEAQAVQAQLAAVLESTGGAAGVTADMAIKLADSLSQVTKFSDEAVLEGENLLLTFTNIGQDIFPETTQVMLDMSTALKQDLSASAMQLGKALQDPIEGVTALRRVGVNFTDSQMDMIKAMVEAGDVMGAQKMILEELQKEFGGSAEAAGKTFAGGLEILKNSLSNVAEEVGTALLPILSDMMKKYIIPLIPHIETLGKVLAAALSGGDISKLVGSLPKEMAPIAEGLAWLAETVINFVTVGIPNFIAGFMNIIGFLQANKGVLVGVLTAIGVAIGAFFISLAASAISLTISMLPVLLVIGLLVAAGYLLYRAWSENWGGIQEKVRAVFDWIKTYIPPVIEMIKTVIQNFLTAVQTWWGEHGAAVIGIVSFYLNNMKAAFQFVFGLITTIISTAMTFIHNLTSGKLGMLSTLWSNTWDLIKSYVDSVLKIIGAVIAAFMAAINGDWYEFGKQLRVIWDTTWTLIKTIIDTAWKNIKIVVKSIVDGIVNLFTETDWKSLGVKIVEGIIKGIGSMVRAVIEAAINIARSIKEAVEGFFEPGSPYKVMVAIGEKISSSMAVGMDNLGKLPITAMSEVNASVAAVSGSNSAGTHGETEGAAHSDEFMQGLIQSLPDMIGRSIRDNLLLASTSQ